MKTLLLKFIKTIKILLNKIFKFLESIESKEYLAKKPLTLIRPHREKERIKKGDL